MGLNLYRVLLSAYQVIDLDDYTRLTKQAWNGAAALAWGLINGETTATAYFFGNAARPTAAAGLSINLGAGVGFAYVVSADDFEHNLKPLILPAAQSVSFDANSDASGHDRIDIVALRPLSSDQDYQDVQILDPITRTKTLASRARKSIYGYQYVVVKGSPAASPSIPSTPAGYFKIAEVTIQNGAGSILSSDIIDRRAEWTASFSRLASIAGRFTLGRDGAAAELIRYSEADGGFAEGDLVLVNDTWNDTDADGILHLGQIIAHSYLKSSIMRAFGADTQIQALNGAGTARANIRAKNTAYAWCAYVGGGGGIQESEGISGVTNTATGVYRFTFTTPLATPAYACLVSDTLNPALFVGARIVNTDSDYCEVKVYDSSGTAANLATGADKLFVVVFAK